MYICTLELVKNWIQLSFSMGATPGEQDFIQAADRQRLSTEQGAPRDDSGMANVAFTVRFFPCDSPNNPVVTGSFAFKCIVSWDAFTVHHR